MRNLIKCFSVIIAGICFFIFAIIFIGQYVIPENVTVIEYSKYESPKLLGISLFKCKLPVASASSVKSEPVDSDTTVQVNLLNIIPVKRTNIKSVKRKYIVLGGEIFGIKLYTDGVLVVDEDYVESENGKINPAYESGIRVGDLIKTVNGESVYTNKKLSQLIENSNGKPIKMTVVRGDQTLDIIFSSAKEKSTGKYKAGLWVRDSTAGIGTVTFYNPENKCFGGLGHAICDVDTGEVMPMINGEMADAYVNGFYKSSGGSVGELCGVFTGKGKGDLCVNCQIGIYGYVDSLPQKEKTIPVALNSEIKVGEAEVICTVDKSGPKSYKIEITKVLKKNNNNEVNKDMVIKITDNELLSKTGGILQGMSGSPIVQNGMLVGAVTHVFVNDPTQGYAVSADKMLEISTCQEMKSYFENKKKAS